MNKLVIHGYSASTFNFHVFKVNSSENLMQNLNNISASRVLHVCVK